MSNITDISWCNIAQIIGESNRFLFHVMLVHVATTIIEGKKSFLGEEFFRTMIITAMAIVLYHIFFRKIVEPKVEKMKLICYDGKERNEKMKEIKKQFPLKVIHDKTYENRAESKYENRAESKYENIAESENEKSSKSTNSKHCTSGCDETNNEDYKYDKENTINKEYKKRYKSTRRRLESYGTPREYSKR